MTLAVRWTGTDLVVVYESNTDGYEHLLTRRLKGSDGNWYFIPPDAHVEVASGQALEGDADFGVDSAGSDDRPGTGSGVAQVAEEWD